MYSNYFKDGFKVELYNTYICNNNILNILVRFFYIIVFVKTFLSYFVLPSNMD